MPVKFVSTYFRFNSSGYYDSWCEFLAAVRVVLTAPEELSWSPELVKNLASLKCVVSAIARVAFSVNNVCNYYFQNSELSLHNGQLGQVVLHQHPPEGDLEEGGR